MPVAGQHQVEAGKVVATFQETVKAYAAGIPRLAAKIVRDPGPQWVYHGLQKLVRNPATRRRFGEWEASRKPSSRNRADGARETLLCHELEQKGLTGDLQVLTAAEVGDMYDYLCAQSWCDEWHRDSGDFALSDVPENCVIASMRLDRLIRAPHLFSLAGNAGVLSVLEKYFGCKPRLEEVYVSWSSPRHGPASAWHRDSPCAFHRDTDGMQVIKLFLFLTDVDARSGPHVYVLASHRRNRLTKPGTFTDAEVSDAFGSESIVAITGARGTCFLEDSFGVHKAGLPVTTGRMLLQLMYSCHPTICPPKRPVIAAGEIADGGFDGRDPYIFGKFVAR